MTVFLGKIIYQLAIEKLYFSVTYDTFPLAETMLYFVQKS